MGVRQGPCRRTKAELFPRVSIPTPELDGVATSRQCRARAARGKLLGDKSRNRIKLEDMKGAIKSGTCKYTLLSSRRFLCGLSVSAVAGSARFRRRESDI
jgi:hypothetical protein